MGNTDHTQIQKKMGVTSSVGEEYAVTSYPNKGR